MNYMHFICCRLIRNGILGISILLVSGCSEDDTINVPDDTLGEYLIKTIQHEGIERSFNLYLPKNYKNSTPAPLVIALHGGGGTGSNFEEVVSAGTLTTSAESKGVVLVMPEGIEKRWNSGRPEIFDGERMYDDVGFISKIIDEMVEKYNIDPKRVYATGISNGGFMAIRLAFELSQKITAIAPVTAQIPFVHEGKQPQFPTSIMLINGTEDPIVPYDGGDIRLVPFGASRGKVLSTQESIEKFGGFNLCNSTMEQPIIDALSDDGTQVEITTFTECAEGTEAILVKIVGGGHTWPGGTQYLSTTLVGPVSAEVDASELILDFFLTHTRN